MFGWYKSCANSIAWDPCGLKDARSVSSYPYTPFQLFRTSNFPLTGSATNDVDY